MSTNETPEPIPQTLADLKKYEARLTPADLAALDALGTPEEVARRVIDSAKKRAPAPTPDRAPGEGERLTDAEIDALEHLYRAALPSEEWARSENPLRLNADGDRLWYGDGDEAATVSGNLGLGLVADRVAAWLAAIASAGPRLLADLREARLLAEGSRNAIMQTDAMRDAAESALATERAEHAKTRDDANRFREKWEETCANACARCSFQHRDGGNLTDHAEDCDRVDALEKERAEHAATRAEGERVWAALVEALSEREEHAAVEGGECSVCGYDPDTPENGHGHAKHPSVCSTWSLVLEIRAALAPAQSTEAKS